MKKDPQADEYAPRYVEVPAQRRTYRVARRNLFWGIALLFAAFFVLGLAVLLGGPRAMLWPLVSLITFTALWVLARLKIFGQRNGVFFAVAWIVLLGSTLAMLERGFHLFAERRAEKMQAANVARGEDDTSRSAAAPDTEPPWLTEALNLQRPDPADGSRVKILQDTTVTIGRQKYRLKAGEMFPFEESSGGEVTFAAGEFLAKIPANEVQILGPQRVQPGAGASAPPPRRSAAANSLPPSTSDGSETEVEITRRARAEAVRRFPALARENSPENKEYVANYNELKKRNSEMLEDPEWPLRLAETLAQLLHWEEVDDLGGAASEDPDDAPPAPPAPPRERSRTR